MQLCGCLPVGNGARDEDKQSNIKQPVKKYSLKRDGPMNASGSIAGTKNRKERTKSNTSTNSNPSSASKVRYRDYFACFYFLKGEALRGLKSYDRAKQMFERAIGEEGRLQSETYLVPYSYVSMAEVAMEEENFDLAISYLDKSKTTVYGGNYDWAQLLGFRVFGIKQKIELRKKVKQQ